MAVVNRVWDAQANAAAGGFVRWGTDTSDSGGASYPGPGTFGVDTSDFCIESSVEDSGGGGGGASVGIVDTTVANHDPSAHAETYFHIPGDMNWVDDLGNVVVDQTEVGYRPELEPGLAAGTWSEILKTGATPFSYRWSLTNQFTYGSPTDHGLGPFSVGFLFRLPLGFNMTTTGYLVTLKDAASNYGMSIGHLGNFCRSIFDAGFSNYIINSSTSLADRAWHHIMMVVDGTDGLSDWVSRLYVDGNLQGTSDPKAQTTVDRSLYRVHIGTYDGGSTFRAQGCIRSVIGIQKALSGPEVLALATATLSP